jgi:hypothetical protein
MLLNAFSKSQEMIVHPLAAAAWASLTNFSQPPGTATPKSKVEMRSFSRAYGIASDMTMNAAMRTKLSAMPRLRSLTAAASEFLLNRAPLSSVAQWRSHGKAPQAKSSRKAIKAVQQLMRRGRCGALPCLSDDKLHPKPLFANWLRPSILDVGPGVESVVLAQLRLVLADERCVEIPLSFRDLLIEYFDVMVVNKNNS